MSDPREPEFHPVATDEPQSEAVKPFIEHLEDLRWMLIKMLVTLSVTVVLCFFCARPLLAVIKWPLDEPYEEHQENRQERARMGGYRA